MIARRKLISLLPGLLAFEHPTLSEIREILSIGRVTYSFDTHRSEQHGLPSHQAALRFSFNAAKVPLVPGAPTIDFPLASLVSDRLPPISTRLFIVDGWLWRVLFDVSAPRFPGLSMLRYEIDEKWNTASVPLLAECDYSGLATPLHDWIRQTAGIAPNGDPQFSFPDSPDLECLYQLYKTVEIGDWTWEAPDSDSEIFVDGERFIVAARDAAGNYLAVRQGTDSVWEVSHDELPQTNRGSDLRQIISSAKQERIRRG